MIRPQPLEVFFGGVGGDDDVAVRQEAADEDGADAASGTGDDDYPILFHVYSLH
jgi:hypothetical protein